MSALLVTLIALGTLAFGAVYPWGYLPMFVAAAAIGLAGLLRGGIPRERRSVAMAMCLVCAAAALQLVPVPRPWIDTLNPNAVRILTSYSLPFAEGAGWVPLSINPRGTRIAMLALVALSLFVLGVPALIRGRSLRRLPVALALFAVPLALFGIYTREHHNGLMYWFWRPESGGGDQFGPFVNRNHFGGWMLMAICLLAGSLFGQVEGAFPDRDAPRQRRLTWLSSAEANGILLMGTALLFTVISLFWTMSRSAITGIAAGATAFAWLSLQRQRMGRARRALVLVALGLVLLAGVTWRGPAQLADWFQDDRSLLGRLEAWRDGWDVVRDFPLFGTGLNTYPTAMLFYQQRNPDMHVAQAHNDYLQLLAEGGLLVTVPAAIAVVLLGRAIRRNLHATRGEMRGYWIRAGAAVGLLAIAVQEVVEFSLQIPANALLCCTLAAIALTPLGPAPASPSPADRRDTIDLPKGSPRVPLS